MLIVQNPDKEIYDKVTKAVINNDGYCPCALTKSPETRCMCKEFLESKTLGECHCGRYIKKEI